MLVKNWMSPKLVTVGVDDAMDLAIRRLKENGIRMMPVMKGDNLVGVITDRDLKRASASDATTLDIHELLYLISRIRVGDIMSREPVTVSDDDTIEEAAEVLLTHKISGLPVLSGDRRLVGVITQSDIFKALISLTGYGKRGVQFGFEADDRPGSIKELADVIRAFGGRVASILSSTERAPEGKRRVYVRAYRIDWDRIDALKDALKQKTTLLYMVDHRSNRREIYGEPSHNPTPGRK
ncbi:MAG: CBS and ACT domain-containing protein [Desulfobacterales bacterium]